MVFDLEFGVDGNIIMNAATMSLMLVPSMFRLHIVLFCNLSSLSSISRATNINAST